MKNFSTSIQRRKRGKRTEYLARLTYYYKTGKRKGVSKSAPTHWGAKRELQDLIDQHVAGGSEVLEARNMTFAALAEYCKETRYCEAFYDEQGRKLYGVREPKKFASMINRLVSSLGHLKLTDITVSHLQQYRRKRLSTRTNRCLSNSGQSRYREFQLTTRYTFHNTDELNASHVRSRAIGDLNDFNSYYSNFENPVIRRNERSLLPYDAPNRFVLWGNFHARYGITVAQIFDIGNGFPLSVIDEDRNFVGQRNRAGRFPDFASLDLQVLKSISAPGRFSEQYRFRVSVKVFNLTNHFNPRDFQGNVASDEFGGFYNGVGRKFGMKFVIEKKKHLESWKPYNGCPSRCFI